jgi:geranylgeranyl diphosphate synthase type II
LRLGAIVAQASSEQLNAVTAYGEKLGLAFQIVDDLLDHRGDVQTLGKRTQKDAGRGKLTFPGLLGVEEATARAESLIAAACDDVAMFGPKASRLESLARYVIERNH